MKDIRVMDNGNWIDLSDLPRWESGRYKGKINWKESVGYKCKFKYDDIEGEIEIVDYDRPKLIVQYLDYDLFKITTGHFRDCQFGKLLKKITNEFKVEIGQTFKDNKRDLIIIDREYKTIKNIEYKYYRYYCNKCSNEDWILESSLLKGTGCNTCGDLYKKSKLGINTIYDTDRWMIDYFGISEKDAKKYTSKSRQKITVKCTNCGKEKKIGLNTIYRTKSIGCSCSDGISYPEKFVISLLDQLNIEYTTQYSPEWANPKRYDFYFELDNKKYIIETHGGQHYINGFTTYKSRGLQEEKENDQYKKELALNNNIDYYIELDCRESNLEWIKNSIINSELKKIFDLSNVDWLKCEEFALSNRVKEVCDYWKLHNNTNKENLTALDLSKIFKLSDTTIRNYLKQGFKFSWCYYNSEEEKFKGSSKAGRMKGKQVEIFKEGKSLGLFESCAELSRQSERLFGVNLSISEVSQVARGKSDNCKGFFIQYCDISEQNKSSNIRNERKNKKIKSGYIKKVAMYDKNWNIIGIFNSCSDLEKQSDLLFKIHLNQDNISAVARGERKTYKGFTFKYIEDEE